MNQTMHAAEVLLVLVLGSILLLGWGCTLYMAWTSVSKWWRRRQSDKREAEYTAASNEWHSVTHEPGVTFAKFLAARGIKR